MVFLGRTFDQQLHLHSGKDSFTKAKKLRRDETEPEYLLWLELRNRKCNGLKFRRQHPVLSFIADFYCHEKKLIVEIDGEVHKNPEVLERDESRTYELEKQGITVIRFTNKQIRNNITQVLDSIIKIADSI
ncbi:MAG TPA: endonuclease domain-containing protein [Bacteroidales bacterium]|nr:endonuclease domain-containing protein [Bacteroidales bacterium]